MTSLYESALREIEWNLDFGDRRDLTYRYAIAMRVELKRSGSVNGREVRIERVTNADGRWWVEGREGQCRARESKS